jgi:hypothetical protein
MNKIVEKIKTRGYWRLLAHPIVYRELIKDMKDCRNIVSDCAVLLRGWDFPHVPQRRDSDTDLVPCEHCYEGWVDWSVHKEIWRFYQSGQFVTYRGLWEDWADEDILFPDEAGSQLARVGVIHTTYQLTEFYAFLSALAAKGIFADGMQLTLDLSNIKGRELWIDAPLRAQFMYPRRTGAGSIEFVQEYTEKELRENWIELSTETILYIFKRFDWEPQPELIIKDQYELLKRNRNR